MSMTPHDILLAEDDPEEAELALSALADAGFKGKSFWVRDGAEALDYLLGRGPYSGRAGMPPPALVLLDIRMPRLDGVEVLKELKQDDKTRCIPVVMLTASRDRKDVDACYQLGANSYVVKPLDYSRFRETLRKIATYWTEINLPRWVEDL